MKLKDLKIQDRDEIRRRKKERFEKGKAVSKANRPMKDKNLKDDELKTGIEVQ